MGYAKILNFAAFNFIWRVDAIVQNSIWTFPSTGNKSNAILLWKYLITPYREEIPLDTLESVKIDPPSGTQIQGIWYLDKNFRKFKRFHFSFWEINVLLCKVFFKKELIKYSGSKLLHKKWHYGSHSVGQFLPILMCWDFWSSDRSQVEFCKNRT